jgi:4-carboxymuconolactone decarboxylase
MDDQERYRLGADARRRILGNAWVDRADADKTAFNTEWQDFITRCAWGEGGPDRISTTARAAFSSSVP